MTNESLGYIYTFGSVVTFSMAAMVYTHYSLKISALWMNFFKIFVAVVISVPVLFALSYQMIFPFEKLWPFFLSGFLGLAVGDYFLLSAYRRLGPARTLVLFGFEPFIVGGFSYFVWEQKIEPIQFAAIFFFIFCLFLFSYEKFKESGQWEVRGLLCAFFGVFMDSIGILLSRYGFDASPDISGLQGHFFRSIAAFAALLIFCPMVGQKLLAPFWRMKPKERGILISACFLGTYLALVFYMQAIKIGKIATVTAVVLADPIVATFFESLWYRRLPSAYMWIAIVCFVGGMACLFYPQWS